MDNSMTQMGKMGNGLKDPFKQKGGTFGLIIVGIGVLIVAMNLSVILAFAQNLLGLVVIGLALAGISYVALDKNFRLALSTWYMIQVRRFMGMVIKMDPISILKQAIVKMYKKISVMETNMSKLNGVRMNLNKKIDEKKEDVSDCIAKIKSAERLGKTDLATIEKRQLSRLTGIVKDYTELYDSSDKWYKAMSKIADMAKLYAMDSENEVEAQEEKYNMIKMSHGAFKSAMSIIKGDPDELALYNQTFEYINDDIMGRLGEMDRVVNSAGGMLDKIDVDKEMFSIKGDDILSQYDEMGIEAMFSGLSNTPKINIDGSNGGIKNTVQSPKTGNISSGNKYL